MKRPLKEQNNYDIPDEKAANMAWEDYSNSNKSIIVTLFAGQQRSSLKCDACGKESVTFEPFFNLSLPIPSKTQCNIMVSLFSVGLFRKTYLCARFYAYCRNASNCTRNQNSSPGRRAHSARIKKESKKPSTSGSCLPF